MLGRPGIFLNTVAEVALVPTVLDAASRYGSRPPDEAMELLLSRRELVPLYSQRPTAARVLERGGVSGELKFVALVARDNPDPCAGVGADTSRQGENPLDEWRSCSTGIELLNFCSECAEREFGGDAACVAAHRVRRSGQPSDLDGH